MFAKEKSQKTISWQDMYNVRNEKSFPEITKKTKPTEDYEKNM